jgi:LysM repeat protein
MPNPRHALLLLTLGFAACARQTPEPLPTPTPDAQSATVREIVRVVEARPALDQPFASIPAGYVLRPGGQVRTGEASRARLDLSDGAILRLAQNSTFALEDIRPLSADSSGGLLARLQLEAGRIWVSLTDGVLHVETPVGVASVRGSFAVVQYGPGDPASPDDDLLVLDCLEGICTAQNESVDAQLGNLERIVLNRIASLRQPLTDADVQAFLQVNPESLDLVMTLTAAPSPSAELTLSEAEGLTAIPPTATSEPPPATATEPQIPVTGDADTPPPAASATPALPAPAPPVPVLGRHVVQNGETLFCIGRGYGVLPAAIARANGLPVTANVVSGQTLSIPAVQWLDIAPGPICATQFASAFPGLVPTSTPTPTPTATPLTPTPTCPPGDFFDPFQQRCRPPEPPATAVADTPTPVPPPPETPEPPTPTFTPPDLTGPVIGNLAASPVVVDSFTTCRVTFTADISDASGIALAKVEWTSYDANTEGPPVIFDSGFVPMSFVSLNGLTYLVQFDVTIPFGGYLDWSIFAADNAGNESASGPGPRIHTSESSCPGQG